MAKLRHLAFEHGYPTVALVQLLPHRQISKVLGSQHGEQDCARDGSDGNHIDQSVGGHRQCRGHMSERPVRLSLLAL